MRRLKLNKLALKVSVWTLLTLVPILGILALWNPPLNLWVTGLIMLVGTGLVVYFVMKQVVARRMELARSTLRQIRKHQFDNLEATRVPRDDELSALIWQVYRTGQTIQQEFNDLKKAENYRREFLGNVSHELKTPIFAIKGFAETLLDGALEDKAVNEMFVEKILNHGHRLNSLVNDLAEISRIETGALKMLMEPFEIKNLIEEVIEALELTSEQHQINLSYHVPPRTPLVKGDRERIRQVLINLIDNGIKYTESGGYVDVLVTAEEPGQVRISVVDDGIGIEEEHIARLTERFYRVDKSRSRRKGGTGLGLAIVKHILEAHRRQLSVESKPDQGSTFSFTLEAVPDERGEGVGARG